MTFFCFCLKDPTVGASKVDLPVLPQRCWYAWLICLHHHKYRSQLMLEATGQLSCWPPICDILACVHNHNIWSRLRLMWVYGSKCTFYSTHVTSPPLTARPPPLNSEKLLLNCTALRNLTISEQQIKSTWHARIERDTKMPRINATVVRIIYLRHSSLTSI